jgi:hypothetical protein
MATAERFEYLLPCGHKSAGLICFHCAVEAYLADERAAERLKPATRAAVPHELTIKVTDPPHVRRFVATSRRR